MLIDIDHKLAFVHIQKTGGLSFKTAMRRVCGRRIKLAAHDPASHGKLLFPEKWDSWYKVAFVRNPWDWWVSGYFWWDFHKGYPTFQDFMANWDEAVARYKFPLRSGFSSAIDDRHGNCLVDFVGRYETLDQDYRRIFAKVGIKDIPNLEHVGKTNHHPYTQYYRGPRGQKLIDKVAKINAKDISRFKYTYGDAPNPHNPHVPGWESKQPKKVVESSRIE